MSPSSPRPASAAESIPAQAGMGLRFAHHRHVIAEKPATAWFEVHPENYMAPGAPRECLAAIRQDYPVSFHAVGLSLGGTDPLDMDHLARLAQCCAAFEPALVSDHLSWSAIDGVYLADLLPLPYTEEALAAVSRNVDAVQSRLRRRLLIENPSRYLAFAHAAVSEAEFLTELVRRTGCGLLCDINNIYVSAHNLGLDAASCLDALPGDAIEEVHLAGHAVRSFPGGRSLCIDDHGSVVAEDVWRLYERAIERFGSKATLIEWDTDIPDFSTLAAEAAKAQRLMNAANARRRTYAAVA